ncbi:MAG: laccase domain-containing protein [Oscillospiraceae bacterium]
MSFRVHREGELEYLTSDVLDGAAHCFSTRFGGVSEGALASLNLGTHRGDRPENVLENYARLGRAVGFAPEETVFTKQVHSALVERVGATAAAACSGRRARRRRPCDERAGRCAENFLRRLHARAAV